MPDRELDAIYAEANRRGLFKNDPDMQRIGHELRKRKLVTDPTQGGLVTPKKQETTGLPPVKLFRTPEESKRMVQQQTLALAADPQVNRTDLTYGAGTSVSRTGKSQLKTNASVNRVKPLTTGQKAMKAVGKAGEVVGAPFRKVDEMAARAVLESGGGTKEAQKRYRAAMQKNPMSREYLATRTFAESLAPTQMDALMQNPSAWAGAARFGVNLLSPSNLIPLGGLLSKAPLLNRAAGAAFGIPAASMGVEQLAFAQNPGQIVEGLLNTLAGGAGIGASAVRPKKPLPTKTTTRTPAPTAESVLQQRLSQPIRPLRQQPAPQMPPAAPTLPVPPAKTMSAAKPLPVVQGEVEAIRAELERRNAARDAAVTQALPISTPKTAVKSPVSPNKRTKNIQPLPINEPHTLTFKQYQAAETKRLKTEYPDASPQDIADTLAMNANEDAYFAAVQQAASEGKQIPDRVADALYQRLGRDAFLNLHNKYPQSFSEKYLNPETRNLNAQNKRDMIAARKEGRIEAQKPAPQPAVTPDLAPVEVNPKTSQSIVPQRGPDGNFYINPKNPTADVDITHLGMEIDRGNAVQVRPVKEILSEEEIPDGGMVLWGANKVELWEPVAQSRALTDAEAGAAPPRGKVEGAGASSALPSTPIGPKKRVSKGRAEETTPAKSIPQLTGSVQPGMRIRNAEWKGKYPDEGVVIGEGLDADKQPVWLVKRDNPDAPMGQIRKSVAQPAPSPPSDALAPQKPAPLSEMGGDAQTNAKIKKAQKQETPAVEPVENPITPMMREGEPINKPQTPEEWYRFYKGAIATDDLTRASGTQSTIAPRLKPATRKKYEAEIAKYEASRPAEATPAPQSVAPAPKPEAAEVTPVDKDLNLARRGALPLGDVDGRIASLKGNKLKGKPFTLELTAKGSYKIVERRTLTEAEARAMIEQRHGLEKPVQTTPAEPVKVTITERPKVPEYSFDLQTGEVIQPARMYAYDIREAIKKLPHLTKDQIEMYTNMGKNSMGQKASSVKDAKRREALQKEWWESANERNRIRGVEKPVASQMVARAQSAADAIPKPSVDGKVKRTAMTSAQEDYLKNALLAAAEELPRERYDNTPGVTIKIPGDGQYTVYTDYQARNLAAGVGKVTSYYDEIAGARPPAEPKEAYTKRMGGDPFKGVEENVAPPDWAQRLMQAEADVSAKLQKKMKGKGLQAGVDPEDFALLAELGAIKLARRAMDFAQWSDALVSEVAQKVAPDYAESLKPHLKKLYADAQAINAAKYGGILTPRQTQDREASPIAPERTETKQTPKQAQTPAEPLTGAKNATTEAEQKQRGLAPVERQAYTTIPEAYEQGRQAVDGGLDAKSLAQSVATKPRVLSAQEVGALAYDRAQIIKAYDQTTAQLAKAVDAGNAPRIADLQAKQERLLSELDTNTQALVKGGREQSAAFQARKLMIGQDFSPAMIQQRAKAAKASALTPDEKQKLEGLSSRLRDTEKRLAEAEAQLAEAKKTPAQKQNKAAQGMPKFSLTAEEAARRDAAIARAKQKLMQVGAAPDVSIIADIAEIGAIYLKAGVRSYAEWRDAIRSDVGNVDEATMQQAWAQVKAEDAPSRQSPFKTPDTFVETLARRLGWEKANDFLDMISDDGEPAILRKLLNGEELSTYEKSRIVDAWRSNAPTRGKQVSNLQAVTALSQIVKEARQYRPPKPRTPEQINAAREKRLTGQIQDFTQKIAAGDFTLPKRREPAAPTEAVKRLQIERDRLKAQIQYEINKLRPRTTGQKIADVASIPRSLVTSLDLSAPLRQGSVLTLANPRLGFRSLAPMLRAFRSEDAAMLVENDIRSRPNAARYEESGLYLAPLNELSLSKREEAYMSTLAEKFPGVRPSERAYVTYLNKLRADTFDALTRALPNATPEELNAVADFINTATGRGKLGASGERASALLSNIFFSPRYLTSRFQLLIGEPLYRGSARSRALVARTLLQYAGAVFAVTQLAKAGGAEVETDPRHTDFMKLKDGKTVVDVLAGLQQAGTYASRMLTGKKITAGGNVTDLNKPGYKGDTRKTLTEDFIRGKLAPVPGSAVNLMAGSDIVGKPANLKTEAMRLLIPMSWPDVYQAAKEEGVDRASAVFMMSLFGLGTQYRSQSDRPKGGSGSYSPIIKPYLPKTPKPGVSTP